MPVDVLTEIVIALPCEKVAAYAADPSHAPAWYANISSVTWEPAGDNRTRMTLRNRGEPSGFAKIGAPVMAAAIRRANRKDLENLRRLLERNENSRA